MNKEQANSDFKQWNYNSYTSEFLSLRCAGDVLNIVSPLGTKSQKEISEAMSIIKPLRNIILKKPMEYNLYDLCAGNALASTIATFLLPIKCATAIDKKPRNRKWQMIKRFRYLTADIYQPMAISSPTVLISVHPCRDLAIRIVELYKTIPAIKHLIMMPCCVGKTGYRFTRLEHNKLGKYEKWSLGLAKIAGGDVYKDNKCLSPCNAVIVASKG